ncbi:bacillithiol biosynthesis deacetylase BshB1 [Rurimicrobium arvi]|uniref:Bacillithiol biosynthesis deacetylase BshB1 n=1 Tax=Rurimicrobium arvi TaxID=2049916 RepID=A0ABP8N481_9BACT
MHHPKLHILAIAAHPDDIELGCAGTLIKHTRMGQQAGILDLTEGELGTRGSVAERYKEAADAAAIMGISVRENARIRDGFFRNDEEHQLKVIHYIRKFRPEIVLTNAPEDRHPDHGRGYRLVSDACFLAGLRRITTFDEDGTPQEAWRPKRVFSMIQDRQLEPTFIVDISSSFDTKMQAIQAYTSQFYNQDSHEPVTYIATQHFTEQIRYRDSLLGKRIGTQYGEGFISVNIPGIDSLDSLIYPELA